MIERERGTNELGYHEIETGDRVRLLVRGGGYIEVFVSPHEPDRIEVRVLEGTLVVRPKVSNVISIGLEGPFEASDRQRRHSDQT